MDNIIFLCSLPYLDNAYTNVLDFDSIESQNRFFEANSKRQLNGNVISDGSREEITLAIPFYELKNYDYLFLIDHNTRKRYYYFIKSKQYKTSASSVVEVELDVYSTYLFDHSILHSFVDRAHVDRWNGSIPTEEVVDEGLPRYDYLITSRETVADFTPSYVITSSEPLGCLTPERLEEVQNSLVDGSAGNGTIGGGADLDQLPESRIVLNSAGRFFIPALGSITATYPKYPLSFVGDSHASCSPNCANCKHTGIDIANSLGTNIYSARAGTVSEVVHEYTDGVGYGKKIVIDHGGGVKTLYAHLNTILVKVGDTVPAASLIGTMGSTGNSTGPHLHWEVKVNGTQIQPDGNNKLPVGYVIPAD